jgi:lipoprotein NlpI
MRVILTAALCAAFTTCLTQAAWGDGVDDYIRQSLTALAKHDADKALEFAVKAVAADPKNAEALYARGAARAALHKPADAVADFDKALELDPKKVEIYDRRGSEQFKRGLFKESVADFDRFLEAKPDEKPGHWRRGISLYYVGRFDDGRKQFAAYEKVDTNDVENAVWHFLCAARADGVEKARGSMLKIGKDNRVPMMKVYDLYHGDAKPEDVLAAAEAGDASPDDRKERLFMAHLYLGLYYDAIGDKKQALEHMTPAAHKYYIDGYMGDVARVHEEVLLKDKETKPK